jgi:hypothetical protein
VWHRRVSNDVGSDCPRYEVPSSSGLASAKGLALEWDLALVILLEQPDGLPLRPNRFPSKTGPLSPRIRGPSIKSEPTCGVI